MKFSFNQKIAFLLMALSIILAAVLKILNGPIVLTNSLFLVGLCSLAYFIYTFFSASPTRS